MDSSRKLSLLRQILGRETGENKNVYHFWCPHHGRSEGREVGYLGVSFANEVFNCWSCEWKGKTFTKIIRYGVRAGKCSVADLEEYLGSSVSVGSVPARTYEPPFLPDGFRSLTEPSGDPWTRQAMEYLGRRGVTPDDILRYRLGFCESGEYRMRIIFPSFDAEGELNFMVGRSIFPEEKFRYKHGEFDRNIVFNEYLVDWDRPVHLVEGPFDMVKAGENSIPLLGTRLSKTSVLFRKIVMSGSTVYLALDPDASRAQLAASRELVRHGVEVMVVPLPPPPRHGEEKRDVGSMTREEYRKLVDRARPLASTADVMRERVSNLWV